MIMRDNTKFVSQIGSDVIPRSVSDIRNDLKGLFTSMCFLCRRADQPGDVL